MKKFSILLLCLVLLSGCARKPVVDSSGSNGSKPLKWRVSTYYPGTTTPTTRLTDDYGCSEGSYYFFKDSEGVDHRWPIACTWVDSIN